MSLVNEALKRARQAHTQAPAVAVTEPALQPAVPPAQTAANRAWVAPAAGVAALLLGVWCLTIYWFRTAPSSLSVLQPVLRANTSAPPPGAGAQESPVRSVGSMPPKVEAQIASPGPSITNAIIASTQPTAATPGSNAALALPATGAPARAKSEQITNEVESGTPASDPAMAGFRLQGIFFGTAKALALINGQTVSSHDEIDGATVLAIERQAVRLLVQGRTNILKLH